MKNLKNALTFLGIFCLIIACNNAALAQEEPVKKDTIIIIDSPDDTPMDDDDDPIEITIGRHKHHDRKDNRIRFSMLDIGVSTYLYDGGFGLPSEPEILENFEQLYGGSININWHLFRHRMPIVKRKLGIEYGLTLSWNDYKFDNDFEILQDRPTFETIPIEKDIKKNKLKTTFIEVPLMLTWTPGKRQSYYISGGVYGGLLVGAKQKIKFEDDSKRKIRDDFNLNKVRYGLEGRVGLGPIAFYVQYSLQDLFQEGTGPVLTPINIGVTVLGF